MKFLKQMIAKACFMMGYQIVRLDYNQNSPVFHNLKNILNVYEHLFKRFRGAECISANIKRAELAARLLGTPPAEAYYIVEAIARTKLIHGDVCEFGVAQGETSAFIANEIRETQKILHLFDSFQGLPKPTSHDHLKDDIFGLGKIENYEGTMNCNKDMVIRRLKDISFDSRRYVIHEGFIEELIDKDKNLPQRVSFAYVDFDFYAPILITLNYLHQVTPAGGIIMVDDYDFFSTGVKTAVDEFIQAINKAEKCYDIEIPEKPFGCFAILYKIK